MKKAETKTEAKKPVAKKVGTQKAGTKKTVAPKAAAKKVETKKTAVKNTVKAKDPLDELVTIPQDAVLDYFPYEDKIVYILDDGKLPDGVEDAVILMYESVNKDGEYELLPLPEEEIESAKKYYAKLIKLFK